MVENFILQDDNPHHKEVLKEFASRFLPEDDPRVQKACSILERILSGSGPGHLRYMLYIVNDPST